MSKLLSIFLVTAAAFSLAPVSFANGGGGWYGGNGNGNHDDNHHDDDDHDDDHGGHCYGGDHHDCDHPGGGGKKNGLDCDAGGPYIVGTSSPFVVVQLDGTGSRNETGYAWSTNYPGAMFDDPTSGRPTLTIPVTGGCAFDFHVTLTVTNNSSSKTCGASVRVRDTEPPVITCPENQKIICGSSESPNVLGRAEATDNCDDDVSITYKDKKIYNECPADRFDHIIERKWKARDNDHNTSTCTQVIDVVKQVTFLDILPGVCPNEYDPNTCTLLPVAILGLDDFNVGNIQWNTVKLYGRNCNGGPVSPVCCQFQDVAGPNFAGGSDCACAVVPPDGKTDLVLHFSRYNLNYRLGLDDVQPGTPVSVVVTGRLSNGCKFIAEDCLLVL